MSKKPNNSVKAAAVLLAMPVERLERLIDMEMHLLVAQNERRQIAEMYQKLHDDYLKLQDEKTKA